MYPNPYESPDLNLPPKTFGRRVYAYPSALANPVPNIAETPMVFDAERWDHLGELSLLGPNYVYTPRKTGRYLIILNVLWDVPMGNGMSFIRMRKNGAIYTAQTYYLHANQQNTVIFILEDYLTVPDFIEFRIYQNTGLLRNYLGSQPPWTYLIIERIG